jgi:DnaJ-class molecular chaperone
MKDLYSILNVTKESSEKDIKKSYKKLAFQYHPDKNKDPEAIPMFKEISEAYEILTNKDKKKIYDQFGYEAVSENIEGLMNPLDLFQSLFNVDFATQVMGGGNIFMFSDMSSGPFPPGFNMQYKMKYSLNVTLNELYNGTKKEFTINHKDRDGSIKKTNYVINVKKGSKNGDNIVVKEGGNYIPGLDITEDLIIQIVEQTHEIYKRKGDDIYIEHEISLAESLCGLNTMIPHLSGNINVNIDEIIKPNSLYKVEGKGMPIKLKENNELTDNEFKNTQYGDLIIDFIIRFPKKLDEKRIEFLKKILNYKENDKNPNSLVALYYKNKEDIIKELMNDNDEEEDEGIGCVQQ